MVINLKAFKDNIAKEEFGMTAAEAWGKNICIDCKQPALPKCHTFEGRKEYQLSAMCEECFDKMVDALPPLFE